MDNNVFEIIQKGSELEDLEQIYKRVKIGEFVQFNGKVFHRIRPINNKYNTHPYHFYCSCNDIYKGNFLVNNKWGESVNIVCTYKVIYKG